MDYEVWEEMTKLIGLKIKKYLDDNGIKYSFVADKINMPMNVFSYLINGKRKMTAEEYFSICKVLDVDADFFVKETEELS